MPKPKAIKPVTEVIYGFEITCPNAGCGRVFRYFGINKNYTHCNTCNTVILLNPKRGVKETT